MLSSEKYGRMRGGLSSSLENRRIPAILTAFPNYAGLSLPARSRCARMIVATFGKLQGLSAFASLFVCLVSTAPAQDAASPVGVLTPESSAQTEQLPVVRATTRAVLIDVVVVDKKNAPVHGLKKDDFVLVEDGQPQQIASFEPLDTKTAPSDASLPKTTLLIDEMNTHFPDIAYARYSVQKLLGTRKTELEQPTALMVLTNNGLVVLQDYTRDPQLLRTALNKERPAISWRLHEGLEGAKERISISLGSLQQIAIANEGSKARNTLVWISPGFPIFFTTQLTREGETKIFAALRNLSNQLLQSRTAIYTVDPTGVRGGAGGGRFRRPESAQWPLLNNLAAWAQTNSIKPKLFSFGDLALDALAHQTGGRSIYGHNEVDVAVASSIAEGGTYYAISYYPANHDFDGKFRKIEVKVAKAEMHARTRDGYYALPESVPNESRVAYRMKDALLNPLTFHSIPVREKSLTFTTADADAQLSVVIDGNSLEWKKLPNGDLQCNLNLTSGDFSPAGKPVHVVTLASSLTVAAGKADTAHGPIPLVLRVAVDPTSQRVRVLVRDCATDQVGSVDVTEFTRPATTARVN